MDPGIVVYDYMNTFFCCLVEKDRWCEEMVSEHMLVYLCSGELELIAPDKKMANWDLRTSKEEKAQNRRMPNSMYGGGEERKRK